MYFCHDNIILWKQESYFDIDFIIRSAFCNLQFGTLIFQNFSHWTRWTIVPNFKTNSLGCMIYPPWKHQKPEVFWWFRGYRKRLVAWNGLRPVFHSYRNQPWFGFISDLICIVNELIMFYKKEALVLNRGKILTKEK